MTAEKSIPMIPQVEEQCFLLEKSWNNSSSNAWGWDQNKGKQNSEKEIEVFH